VVTGSRKSEAQPKSKELISRDAHNGLCLTHPIGSPRAVYAAVFNRRTSCSNGGLLMARAPGLALEQSALPWHTRTRFSAQP